MKYLKIAGLALVAVLAVSMAMAGNAFAAPLLLVCLERASGKFTTNQCTTGGAGTWESEKLPVGKSDTVRILVFSLRLRDKGAPIPSEIECNSSEKDEGEGTITGENAGQVTKAKITEPNVRCRRISGGCEANKIEEVHGVNLPWNTKVEEVGGALVTKIENSGAGEPGWAIRCHAITGAVEDKCESRNKEYEELTLTNAVTGGILLIKGVFKKAHLAFCSLGQKGKEREGSVENLLAILLRNGNGLSLNKE